MAGNFSQGDHFEVTFEAGRDGSPMTHVNGKVSFPERGGKLPKVGETWEVELAGTNPKGTVHFLRLIRRTVTQTPKGLAAAGVERLGAAETRSADSSAPPPKPTVPEVEMVAVEATVIVGGSGSWSAAIRPAPLVKEDSLFEGFRLPVELAIAAGRAPRGTSATTVAEQIAGHGWRSHKGYGGAGGGSGAKTTILISADEIRRRLARWLLRKHQGRQPYKYDKGFAAWAEGKAQLEQHFAPVL